MIAVYFGQITVRHVNPVYIMFHYGMRKHYQNTRLATNIPFRPEMLPHNYDALRFSLKGERSIRPIESIKKSVVQCSRLVNIPVPEFTHGIFECTEPMDILEIRARNNHSRTLPISLENPSNNDDFSKFSKKPILLTITGRGHAIKKSTQNLAANKQFKLGIILYLNCL